MLTEFFEPPQPKKIRGPGNRRDGLADTTLFFGQTRMGHGKAFVIGDDNNAHNRMPVYKNWEQINGRNILIEELPYQGIAASLNALPPVTFSAKPSNSSLRKLSRTHLLTPAHLYAGNPNNVHIAKADRPPAKGVVLDYVIVDSDQTNFTFQADTTYFISGELSLTGTTTINGDAVIKYDSNAEIPELVGLTIFGPLVCNTGPYRPGIFTVSDDNTVGETIDGSSGNPGDSNPNTGLALDHDSGIYQVLSYLSFCNAVGVQAYVPTLDVWNCQFAGAGILESDEADINYIGLHNVLFMGSSISDVSGTLTISGEQVTCDGNLVVWAPPVLAAPGSIYLTNSILTGDLDMSGTVVTNCVVVDSGPSVFQTVGAGTYYLATDSPYQNAGTTNINPAVLADIAAKTTYPPILYSNTIISASPVYFEPQVRRDNAGNPDLGYHYDPIDYDFGGVILSNTTAAIYPGTVIGAYGGGSLGFGLGLVGSTLISQGLATNWNFIIENQIIQEGTISQPPLTNGLINMDGWSQLDCRFMDSSILSPDALHILSYYYPTPVVTFRDCQFHGGGLELNDLSSGGGSYIQPAAGASTLALDPSFNNCLFEYVYFEVHINDGSIFTMQNSLLRGGTFDFYPGYSLAATVEDNLFDQTTIPDYSDSVGPFTEDHNAYVTNCDQLQPSSGEDLVLTNSPAYCTGPFGNYYYQCTASPLINAGSTTADQLGLYDYTVLTNLVNGQEIKETNSVVDIGYHYVAVDTNGVPLDTYTNGIPDYMVTSTVAPIPDWWEWLYFGNLDQGTNIDYDSDGTNILTEYQNGVDPNKIAFFFSVPNLCVSASPVAGILEIQGGIPTSIAILVDNTNFTSATWTPYTSPYLNVDIGDTPGFHDIWIGLRGLPANAQPTWQETSIMLSTNPPGILITNPVNNVMVNATRIDVSGDFSATPLGQITVNGVPAFINGTNFEAINVPLVGGTNLITAIIQTLSGASNTASINIIGVTNSDGSLNEPVLLQAAPVAGIAPLPVSFTIQTNFPGTIQQISYDFNGDDVADLITNNLLPLTYTYATNGAYFPVVTIQTTDGRFSSVGGWNSGTSDSSNQPIQINVQPALTQTVFANVTDPVDLKWNGNNLFVLSGSGATITEFDTNADVVTTLSGLGTNPTGFDVDSAGNIYVAVTSSNQVWRFIPMCGAYVADTNFGFGGFIGTTNGTASTTNGQFNGPFGVALSPDGGTVSVSDSGNDRIEQFVATNGAFIAAIGTNGNAVGEFNLPKGMAYDTAGTLYIVDSGNSRIALIQGTFADAVTGTNGTVLGQLQNPTGISIDERGVYIADSGNDRIQSFDLPLPDSSLSIDSSSVRFAITAGLDQPAAVAALDNLTNEMLYVADTSNNRVLFYSIATDDPTPAWTNLMAHIADGDVEGALANFSVASVDQYRQTFLSVGKANAISALNQIGTLMPVYIINDRAEYYFTNTIEGQIITFPVDFVKENGVWKVLEF